MKGVPLFTWWRLMLLAAMVAAGALWVRSYYRADSLNYRTTSYTHLNLRGQGGVLAFEAIDESTGAAKIGGEPIGLFWYVSSDGVCDTQRWGFGYDLTSRADVLGFIWIKGSYYIETSRHGFFWAPARALAIPFWFLLAAPALLLIWLLYRALQRRRHQIAGHCPACGYDLRASPQRCPECGRAVDGGAG